MNSIALAIVAGAVILAYVLGHYLRQINQTIATQAVAVLVAARLTDQEYMKRVEELRITVKHGLEFYPGSPEKVREIEEEIKIAKEMLREIDYQEPSARRPLITLVAGIYQEVASLGG